MSPLPSIPNNLIQSAAKLSDNETIDRFAIINNRINTLNKVTEALSADTKTKKAIVDRVVDSIVSVIRPSQSEPVDIEELDVQLNMEIDKYKNDIKIPSVPTIPQTGLLAATLSRLPKITIPSPADFIEAKDLLIERLKEEQQRQSISQLMADAKAQERPFTARFNAQAKESANTNSVVLRDTSSFVTSSL